MRAGTIMAAAHAVLSDRPSAINDSVLDEVIVRNIALTANGGVQN